MVNKGLEDALDQLLVLAGQLPDLKEVHPEPPDQMLNFPCAIAYPFQGELGIITAGRVGNVQNKHVLMLDIHQTRIVVPQAFTAVKFWPRRIIEMLANNRTLNGSVSLVEWPVTYEAAVFPYGREEHYGMRFHITVRIY